MSDREVAEALRSDARLVLIEAPAGFGKTFQGAEYAKDLLPSLYRERLLILTHTHAAREAFASRTGNFGNRAEIRTIDNMITSIASVYHKAIGIPPDASTWAFQQGQDGFRKLAAKVALFLKETKTVASALSSRYPYVVCDEHQDSNEAQHEAIFSVHKAGSLMRVFADPMQAIYESSKSFSSWSNRWTTLCSIAGKPFELDTPHRWRESAPELGQWVKEAREALKTGREINLHSQLPRGLTLIRADNLAERHGRYAVCQEERTQIDAFVRMSGQLMILTSTNETVGALRAFFNRSIPIWEGHTRDALSRLILGCQQHTGCAPVVGDLFINFVQDVACGFSNSAYANRLREEIKENCCSLRRQKSAEIQGIARLIVECPDHRGIGRALGRLQHLANTDRGFRDIKVDLKRELRDAIRLAEHDDPSAAQAELAAFRTVHKPVLPPKVISTIHKAKGLECRSVLVLPCDREHFGESDAKRRLLYVALSRATESLALVVPRKSPSPLLRL
jgi:DNA helicase-2/ATP-dependent DNA helicase PcrA